MTKDIIVSRHCSVSPDGVFMPGPTPGYVTICINFFRPALDPDVGPNEYPAFRCDYEIRFGNDVVHEAYEVGMDGAAAILSAMVSVAVSFDNRYFNSRAAEIPAKYLDAIPARYFDDMRKARG
jgi:hypothetical protein